MNMPPHQKRKVAYKLLMLRLAILSISWTRPFDYLKLLMPILAICLACLSPIMFITSFLRVNKRLPSNLKHAFSSSVIKNVECKNMQHSSPSYIKANCKSTIASPVEIFLNLSCIADEMSGHFRYIKP